MSTTVTVHVEEQEKLLFKAYAKAKGITLSELIRNSMLEYIEDEYDVKEYRDTLQKDSGIRYFHEDMMKAFGL